MVLFGSETALSVGFAAKRVEADGCVGFARAQIPSAIRDGFFLFSAVQVAPDLRVSTESAYVILE